MSYQQLDARVRGTAATARHRPPGVVRVLSVPSGHAYVAHLSPVTVADGVVRLTDPSVGPGVPVTRWWPPPALGAAWVLEHAEEFDVCHVHFGFDDRSPQQLRDFVAALRRSGKPLVYTVHDLRNPHMVGREPHDGQLDVLVPAADALVTLTAGAATEIRRRWHREALVLPHPHVVEEPRLSAPRPGHDGFVVGVHLKSLRANTAAGAVLEELTAVVPALPGARLRVDVHHEVLDPAHPRHDAALLDRLHRGAATGSFALVAHDLFSDDELWDYLSGLDVSVLPYRFGTHSGWLEACHDLGTTVLAPTHGFYAEQQRCYTFDAEETGSLANACRRAHTERPHWRAEPHARRVERDRIAAAHRSLYHEVLERRVA